MARRNLTPIQLSHYRGLHYRADRTIIKNVDGKNQYSEEKEVKSQNGTKPQDLSTATRLAGQYHVSRNTINRDAKVAQAIDAIGGVSPEAKRMILSGEANIQKKELQELPSKSQEELTKIAASIEDGTYEKEKNKKQVAAIPAKPADDILADMQTLDTAIGVVSDSFLSLPKNTTKADREKLKAELRAYIDQLEKLYNQL